MSSFRLFAPLLLVLLVVFVASIHTTTADSSSSIQFLHGALDTSHTPSLLAKPTSHAQQDMSTMADDGVAHHILVKVDPTRIAYFGSLLYPQLVSFFPQDTFLIKATTSEVQALAQSHSGMLWANILPAEYRMTPRLAKFLSTQAQQASMSVYDEAVTNLFSDNDTAMSLRTDSITQSFPRAQRENLSKYNDKHLADSGMEPTASTGMRKFVAYLREQAKMDMHFSTSSADPFSAINRLEQAEQAINTVLRTHTGTVVNDASIHKLIQASGTHQLTIMVTGVSNAPKNEMTTKSASHSTIRGFVDNMQKSIDHLHQQKSEAFIQSLFSHDGTPSPSALSNTLTTTQTLSNRLLSVFSLNDVTPSSVFHSIAQNMADFMTGRREASSQHERLSQQSTAFSFIPFASVLSYDEQAERPTHKDTRVPLGLVRARLQSPLFTHSPSSLAKVVSQRVYDIIMSPTGVSTADIESVRSYIAQQYAQDQTDAATTQDADVVTDLDDTLLAQSESDLHPLLTTAALVQYLDAVILAVVENHPTALHSDTVHVQGTLDQDSQAASYVESVIQVTSAIIDVQNAYLSELQQDIIHTILAQDPNVFTVDLTTKVSITNKRMKWFNTINEKRMGKAEARPVPNAPYNTPYHALGIRGQHVIVGVSDTGIDVNSCFFYDPNNKVPFTLNDRPSSSLHRKIASYHFYANQYDHVNTSSVSAGHGTHVAGTIAGLAVNTSGNPNQSSASVANGSATEARVAFFDIGTGDDGQSLVLPNNLSTIFQHGYNNGARIYSNSWGCSTGITDPMWDCNSYDELAFQIDQYLHEHPEMTILFAAGNEGRAAYATLGSSASSKNAVIVGATYNNRGGAAEHSAANESTTAYRQDPTTYDPDVATYFTSTGPTHDGRIKPDIVSMGFGVSSARSQGYNGRSTSYTCNTYGMTGTSMATPGAAGAAALMYQMLQEGRIQSGDIVEADRRPTDAITGSLLKSLMVNSAQHVDYHGFTQAANNMPMATQTIELPTEQFNGVNYAHMLLGGVYEVPTFPVNLYVAPTPNKSSDAPTTRTYRMYMYFECRSARVRATVQFESGGSTSHTFQPYSPSSTHYFDFSTAKLENVYLTLSSDVRCDVELAVAEFDGSSVLTSSRFQDIDCNSTPLDFPLWNVNDFTQAPSNVFRCPSILNCIDKNISNPQKVYGVNYYSLDSSVCRSAIHLNTFNVTALQYNDKDAAADMNNLASRQFVKLELAQIDSGSISFDGYKHNGVQSHSVRHSAGTFVFQPVISGVPLEDNDYLYLSPLAKSPNTITGHGRIMIHRALPLNKLASDFGSNSPSKAPRNLLILNDGVKSSTSSSNPTGITHKSVHTHCFYVSPLSLDTYSYTEEGNTLAYATDDDLSVTLSWYDYAGSNIASKLLVNDLNLFLFTPAGHEHRGNQRADRKNNVEKINLPSQTAGMYCSVVHGVYVPIKTQQYSLVANGRGLEQCTPLTFPGGVSTLSGKYTLSTKAEHTSQCAGSQFQTEPFITTKNVHVVQAGNCLNIHAVTTPNPPPQGKTIPAGVHSGFHGLRLSTPYYEEANDVNGDESNGFAFIDSKSELALSAKIALSGSSIELNGHHVTATGEPQVIQEFSGAVSADGASITISFGSDCTIVYEKDSNSDGTVDYLTPINEPEAELEPIPDSAVHSTVSLAFAIVISALFFLF